VFDGYTEVHIYDDSSGSKAPLSATPSAEDLLQRLYALEMENVQLKEGVQDRKVSLPADPKWCCIYSLDSQDYLDEPR
jgi:hypothetical protein